MRISEKSNGRIIEKWLKFPSSHSDQRNRLLNFTPAIFRRFKDLEPMLNFMRCSSGCSCYLDPQYIEANDVPGCTSKEIGIFRLNFSVVACEQWR